jgi:arsenite-transporting ATPase
MENLYAQEIDADQRVRAYQEEIRQKIREMYGMTELPEEIESYIQAASAEPAMEESAIFDAVVDIVVAGDYDYYIYDLVPLGHALYYLSMATVYDAWIDKITGLREQMRNMTRWRPMGQGTSWTGCHPTNCSTLGPHPEKLSDPHRQSRRIFFVVVPESMIINDTLKAADLFAKFKVPINGYVVNRVLPESLKTEIIPDYLKHRLDMQGKYLTEIRETFGTQVLAQVPELERDVTGLPMIARVAELLCG